jgi:hypothetical protein
MALVNVGNLSPDYGDQLEDDFNSEMLNITGNTHDLNSNAPNEEQVLGIISSLRLPLGKGFLVGPTELSGCEQQYADRINNALTANENVAFVIGYADNFGHAYAIFWDHETRKWYRVNPSTEEIMNQCDDIRAHVENGGIVLSDVGSNPVRNIVGGNFVMMVSREH